MMTVRLLPIGDVDPRDVASLAEDLAGAGFRTTILQTRPVPGAAWDPRRHQYRAQALLDLARDHPSERVLAVTDLDLYSGDMNFVFGLADSWGTTAVVSFCRLRVGAGSRRFRERALREAVHEIGHTLGLDHCFAAGCVMQFSNSLEEVDRKGRQFCPACSRKARTRLAS